MVLVSIHKYTHPFFSFFFKFCIQDGLKDHYDIKMLTYLMVSRVAQLCPGAVLQRLDKLIEPLKVTCTTKVKTFCSRLIFFKVGPVNFLSFKS